VGEDSDNITFLKSNGINALAGPVGTYASSEGKGDGKSEEKIKKVLPVGAKDSGEG